MTWLPKYNPEMCAIATKVLAGGESLAAVCCELNVTRTTLYEWRDSKPEFRDAISLGLQKAQRVWESIGRSGITGELEKFGGAPYIFTMKNRFRDDYKDDKHEEKTVSDKIVEQLIDKLID